MIVYVPLVSCLILQDSAKACVGLADGSPAHERVCKVRQQRYARLFDQKVDGGGQAVEARSSVKAEVVDCTMDALQRRGAVSSAVRPQNLKACSSAAPAAGMMGGFGAAAAAAAAWSSAEGAARLAPSEEGLATVEEGGRVGTENQPPAEVRGTGTEVDGSAMR